MLFPPLVTNTSSISVRRAVLAFGCNSTSRRRHRSPIPASTRTEIRSRTVPETVVITVESIRDQLFLVTWQESDGTTVVHLEDYRMNTIITNITQPGNGAKASPQFSKFSGTMRQLS
jgi:hypothetical protein